MAENRTTRSTIARSLTGGTIAGAAAAKHRVDAINTAIAQRVSTARAEALQNTKLAVSRTAADVRARLAAARKGAAAAQLESATLLDQHRNTFATSDKIRKSYAARSARAAAPFKTQISQAVATRDTPAIMRAIDARNAATQAVETRMNQRLAEVAADRARLATAMRKANDAAMTATEAVYDIAGGARAQVLNAQRTAQMRGAKAIAAASAPKSLAERIAMRAAKPLEKVSGAASRVKSGAVAFWNQANPILPKSAPAEAVKPGILRRTGGWVKDHTVGAVTSRAKAVAGRINPANIGGRVVRGVGRAAYSPASLAASAWIDASIQAYDFFTDPALKHGPGVMEAIGADWTGFGKTYLDEVRKGAVRLFTLGLFGNSSYADDMKQWNEDHGASLTNDIDAVKRGLAEKAPKSLVPSKVPIDKEGYRHYLGKLVEEHDARVARYTTIRDHWDSESRGNTALSRFASADEYFARATADEDARHSKAFAAALDNSLAWSVMDDNRAAAYSLYTGRDYAKDAAASVPDAAFHEFNQAWDQTSDVDKALWNRDKETAAYNKELTQLRQEGGL